LFNFENKKKKRLRGMLVEEQAQQEHELQSRIESPLERAAALREKARLYREIKKNENAMFVEKKMEQKWRGECDELRTQQSKFVQSGQRLEHQKQIEEKIFREKQELTEERVFADMWAADIASKDAKQARQVADKLAKNRAVSEVLKEQMLVLERQKQEEKVLKIQNARLLEEKRLVEKLEKEMRFKKKREDQAARRHELGQYVALRERNEARKLAEELSFDLKALENSLVSYHSEDQEKAARKLELMEEQRLYREYLKEEYEADRKRQKELDTIIMDEVQVQFEKRLKQWKAEKQARRDMLEKVIIGRRAQIEAKMLKNEQRKSELEREKVELNSMIEYYKQQERAEREQVHQKNHQYGADLNAQMSYLSARRTEVRNEDREDYEAFARAENEYQEKINRAIGDLHKTKVTFNY